MSSFPVRLGLALVHGYQLLISPFVGGACRFEPSCSVYAATAIEEHGLLRGLLLSLKRMARCHPLARPGFDPVPPRSGHR